VKKEEPV